MRRGGGERLSARRRDVGRGTGGLPACKLGRGRLHGGVCEDTWVSGCVDDGPGCSVACSSAVPMVATSGVVAAWAWAAECRSIEATVRPPPTSATAVATTARRWFFFQRAIWRRRAARPCGAGVAPSMSPYGSVCGASSRSAATAASSSGRPSCHASEAEYSHGTDALTAVPVGAMPTHVGTMPRSAVAGAMSGA